jgi:guanylate kinase
MPFILIGGPTGVGKSSVIDHLIVNERGYSRPTAYTTRPSRPEETAGQFIHVSNTEMDSLNTSSKLLSLDEVHGNRYALAKNSIESLTNSGLIAIKEFYLRDHMTIKRSTRDVLSVAIMPSSSHKYLHHIESREDIRNRLATKNLLELSELSESQSIIDQGSVDIIIINDFKDSIDSLATTLHKAIQAAIPKNLKNQFNPTNQ